MKVYLVLLIIFIAGCANIDSNTPIDPTVVDDFESCVEAGNPVMESYPRQCRHGDDHYVEEIDVPIDPTPEPESLDVPIKSTYDEKIVYDYSANIDDAKLDCQQREGKFNECGKPCPADAEACTTVCAYTCEFDYIPPKELSTGRPGWEFVSDAERAQLPDCSGITYTHPPVNLGVLEQITPLGNLNPPGHTIPTEHPYLALKKDYDSTEMFDLYAPGDVWIIHTRTSKGQTQDPEDSSIFFALCKDVFGYYNHVKDFSSELDSIVAKSETVEPVTVFEKVDAGTVLGKVGRLQGNFDFGTWDESKEDNDYINKDRYTGRSLKITCAFDYYSEPLKSQLYEKINRPDGTCGDVNYDKENTIRGSWFVGDSDAADWQTTMIYLGPDNDNPELSVISASDIGGDSLLWKFTAETSGNVNLQFDKTTTNTVYCYDEDEWTNEWYENAWGAKGKILFRTDGKVLEVEHKSGKCSDNESINNPIKYKR